MLKKIGLVTAGVTASLLAVVPFAAATEDHPAPTETTSCDNGNGAHTGSDSQVKQTNAFNFNCAQIFSNNGELNQGSNNPDSSVTGSNNPDNSTTDSNNPNSSTNSSNNPDSSVDNSQDNSEGLKLPGFGG